ncbi:MAG: serine/threonine protein kinase [Labilithrix sp.]|nr:serine/threonine protein kinase [Labilithrix sp.]
MTGIEQDGEHEEGEPEDGERSDDAWLRAVAHVPAVAPDASLGETLGRYRLVRLLGRGGMGVVYLADDERLGRSVALKVLPADAVGNAERRRRFVREAKLAASLSHPNIATVHDAGEIDQRMFIAIEYVEGETLRDRLASGPLAPAEIVRIGSAVARGLAKAHDAGIIHRDIKPENVMLAADAVKILDFGTAKTLSGALATPGDGAATTETADGRILGTPAYMSPEQAKGRPVDRRTDVFSLGVTLYEMATGRRAFEGETTLEVLIAIDRDDPPRASTQNRAVPPALERVIHRCLRKDPAQRYASAGELGEDLERASPARASETWKRFAILAVAIAGVAGALRIARAPASPERADPAPAASAGVDPAPPAATHVAEPLPAAPSPSPSPSASSARRIAPFGPRASASAVAPPSSSSAVSPPAVGPLEEPK